MSVLWVELRPFVGGSKLLLARELKSAGADLSLAATNLKTMVAEATERVGTGYLMREDHQMVTGLLQRADRALESRAPSSLRDTVADAKAFFHTIKGEPHRFDHGSEYATRIEHALRHVGDDIEMAQLAIGRLSPGVQHAAQAEKRILIGTGAALGVAALGTTVAVART